MTKVGVDKRGAVRLGDNAVSDGHIHGYRHRIQSHLHFDHMKDWNTSLFGKVYLSKQSKALLNARRSKFAPEPTQIIGLETNRWHDIENFKIRLQENSHMLGAVHVIVEEDGKRFGYSGDFNWPPSENFEPIELDTLVVDATCNDTRKSFDFDEGTVDDAFRDLIRSKFTEGPILLQAFRGTMERALQLIADLNVGPIVMDEKDLDTTEVYRDWGYAFPSTFIDKDSTAFKNIVASNERYIEAKFSPRRNIASIFDGTNISCSAFSPEKSSPIRQEGNRSYTVAMTNHADADGTIEYIESTKASKVIVDSTRNGNADALAKLIKKRLQLTDVYPSDSLQ